MTNNFNFVAPFYDRLARLVFGESIRKAQLTFLSEIAEGDQVLIMGGGSGWLLTELDQLGFTIFVEYVEASSRMIELAKTKGSYSNLEVSYVLNESYMSKRKYDVVITPFFLDVFDQKTLSQRMTDISRMLKTDGIWLQTDFVRVDSFWKKLLIKIMYVFFKLTCGIKASKLLDFHRYFLQQGFSKQQSKLYYGKMIEASIYKRAISI